MPLLADRVKESTTTAGTSNLTLAGAPPGFQTFSGAFGNAVSVYYVIAGATEWEVGIGTTGAGTLSRDTILASSAGGAKVNLSAGTKDVFCSYVAGRAVTTSDAATLTNKTIDDYTNNVGANSTHFRIKAGATLVKGDVVKASGFTPGQQAIEVVKVASSTDVALGFVEQALATGEFGTAVVIGELFDVNTNGLAVGATLYSNGTGGFTTTRPSSGLFQALGWVVRANTNNGVIAVNVVNPQYVEASTNTANTLVLRDGSGNFSAGTITATSLTVSGNVLAATTAQGAAGLSVSNLANVSFAEGSGLSYVNIFRQSSSAATVLANGYKYTVTSNGFASSTGVAWPKAAIALDGGNIKFFADGSTTVANGTDVTPTERMRLDTSGNLTVDTNTLYVDAVNNCVGIGTTSPNAYGALAVFSAGIGLHANSTSGAAGLNFYEGGSGRFSLRTLNGTAGLSFFDSFNAVERALFTSSGNLGVNCSATNAKLEVLAATGEVFRADASGGAARIVADQDGVILGGNIALGVSTSFGGGSRVVAIREAQTVPTTNPVGNGLLYVEGGALKYRGTSGTVTTIANA